MMMVFEEFQGQILYGDYHVLLFIYFYLLFLLFYYLFRYFRFYLRNLEKITIWLIFCR